MSENNQKQSPDGRDIFIEGMRKIVSALHLQFDYLDTIRAQTVENHTLRLQLNEALKLGQPKSKTPEDSNKKE
jgi:hypothetical protein